MSQLAKVEARISEVERSICASMYTDTLAEALEVAKQLRHEVHVMALQPARHELDFLRRRKEALEVKNG